MKKIGGIARKLAVGLSLWAVQLFATLVALGVVASRGIAAWHSHGNLLSLFC